MWSRLLASSRVWQRAAVTAVALSVTLSSGTVAFVAPVPNKRIFPHEDNDTFRLPQRWRPTTVLCQSSAVWEIEETDKFHYEDMTRPDQRELLTHILYSQLLKANCVERFKVYRRVSDSPDDTSSELVVADVSFGELVDGYPGIVHGGLLTLVVDELLGYAFFAHGVSKAFTANLNINFRQPVRTHSSVIIRIQLDKQEGRKLFFKGQMTSPDGTKLYLECTSLFIIPKDVFEQTKGRG